MPFITISKAEALDILDSGDYVRDRIIDHRRWSVMHELIFRRGGKIYRATYDVGATEYQDETPWQYDDEVQCWEVKPVSVIDYVKIPEPIRIDRRF